MLRAANNAFAGRMWPAGREFETPALEYCSHSGSVVVCGMQKQSKGKAARTLANLAGFESLTKMAAEPWYGDAYHSVLSITLLPVNDSLLLLVFI